MSWTLASALILQELEVKHSYTLIERLLPDLGVAVTEHRLSYLIPARKTDYELLVLIILGGCLSNFLLIYTLKSHISFLLVI